MKQKQTQGQREQPGALQGGGRGVVGGMEWEAGVSRCKLSCIGWRSKVLPYSTENYIQYPMINHIGKEYETKMYIYV